MWNCIKSGFSINIFYFFCRELGESTGIQKHKVHSVMDFRSKKPKLEQIMMPVILLVCSEDIFHWSKYMSHKIPLYFDLQRILGVLKGLFSISKSFQVKRLKERVREREGDLHLTGLKCLSVCIHCIQDSNKFTFKVLFIICSSYYAHI